MKLKRLVPVVVGVALLTAGNVVVDPGADASPTVVHLTAPLLVQTGDSIRDVHYIWDGPSDQPIVVFRGAQFATMENVVIEVASGHHATTAIQLDDNPPNGGPFNNELRNIRIGNPGAAGGFDYGMRWNGSTNGDSNTMTNITVHGAGVASVYLENPQATVNTFRSIFSYDAPVGLWAGTGGTIQCENCVFSRSTDVDVKLFAGSRLLLTAVRSTGSRSFVHYTAGVAAGGLTVVGGEWQWSSTASGPTIVGTQPSGSQQQYPMSLRLQDFRVTPLAGGPYGSITGFTPNDVYLSNVRGIA